MNNMSLKTINELFKKVVFMSCFFFINIIFFMESIYAKGKKQDSAASNIETVAGGTLDQDKVVTGTKALLKDAIPVLQAVGATACALLAIYFFIRKAQADEQDQKMWKNRITITIISAIGIVVIGGIITTIVSYYK